TQLDLGLALQSIRGLSTTLKTCLRAAIEISGMDAGGIYLVDDLSGSVDLILSQNLDDEFVKSVSHYPAGSANAQMVMAGKPIYTHFNKTGIAHIPVQEREKLRAVAIIPVVSMGRVIACINISSHIFDEIPSNARVGLETIATQIGTAIERIRTDEALAQSEQKYRNVVEDQTEFICRFLPDGTHVFVNEAYCRYFGKTCREIIGTRFVPRVVDEDKQRVQQHFRQLTWQNPVATMEHRIIMPDGRMRWQQWSDRAIFNEQGMLVEYQSVGRDITDRKMADEELIAAYEQITATEEELREQYDELKKSGDALQESEENYRALFDDAADLIVIVDAHGTFLNLNRKFVEESGYEREEMIGKNVLTSGILTAPSAAKTAFHLGQIILGKKLPFFEIDGVAKDGTVIPYEVRATPITKNGKISAFQAILRNLTGRKEAEKEIRESRTRLEEIVHGSPIPQFVIDKNHRVISWNRALEEYSGVKAKDVIGTTDTWKAFYDKERPVLADLLVENNPGKISEWYSGKYHPSKYVEGAYEATDFFPRMGKTGIWLYFTASALRDYDGNIVGAVETLEDITEQKNADEELQASYEQITASEEELRDQYDELKKNEDTLRESEERYRTVFENTGTAMVILEEDTTISFANTQFERLTGYSRDEIEGKKHWTEFVVPEDLEWMKEQHRARRESDKKALTQYEFRSISRSGEIHTIFLNIDMIPGTTKSVASLLDITERKKSEDALRESEQQLRMIANTVPGVLYQFYARSSGEMGMYYTSERSLELFGISTDPTTFFPRFTECVATEDREAFLTSIDKSIKTGGKWDYKGRFIKPTGEEIYFHGMSEPVRSGDELVFHGVLLDITAQERAERALHASEEQYRSLVETTGTGYVIIDKDGRVITANQEYVRLTGRSTLAEIQGSAVTSWTAPYDLDRNTSEVVNCIRNGKVRGLEIDYQKPDGTIQPVEINASVIQSDSGQTILTLCRDITRRRSVAKALEKEQEFTRLLLDTSPAFFVAIGADGRTLTMNQALIDALEYPADEITGIDYLTTFVPEEDREMVAGVFRKIACDGSVIVNENRMISKSGKVYLVEWHGRLVKHEDKNPDFIVSVGIDITERKRAEEALRESEKNYRVIVENMEDMFYRTDKKGNLIMVSPSAARIAGYSSPEEMFGLDTRIFYPDPNDRDTFLAALRKTGSVTSYLLPFKRRDGTIREVTASSHYYYDKDGSVSGVEGILHDVTALHEAGNALCEANKKLNLFNSITRHDMLNQLTILRGYLKILLKQQHEPVSDGYLEKCSRVTEILEHQISFTRDYQNMGVKAPDWQHVKEMIQKNAAFLPVGEIRITTDIPDFVVYADPLLEKVFYNLIDNALK
ncbi:MAG: PAS domain S-box protein, partial [Methanoregula sp.]